jgi:hypothetical protein
MKEETLWEFIRSDWRRTLFVSFAAAVAIGILVAMWLV